MYPCPQPSVCKVDNHRSPDACRASSASRSSSSVSIPDVSVSSRTQASIDDIKSVKTRDTAHEFIDSELGGQFDPSSLDVESDGSGFSLAVEDSFQHEGRSYEDGQRVRFDPEANIIE